jgi:hypothetical protein
LETGVLFLEIDELGWDIAAREELFVGWSACFGQRRMGEFSNVVKKRGSHCCSCNGGYVESS